MTKTRTYLLIAAAAALGVAGFIYSQGSGPPQAGASAGLPAEPGAPIVAVRMPEQLSSQAMMGARAYDAVCASCHGKNTAGQQGVAPSFVSKIYRPAHHGDMAFVVAVQNGVRAHHWKFGNMPPVEGLTRSDVMNIVAYVREVQRENGIN